MKKIPVLKSLLFPAIFLLLFSCATPETTLEDRASEIHSRILTLDSHADTPLMMLREGFDIGKRNDPHDRGGKIDFPRMFEGGLDAAFFAVYLGQGERNEQSVKATRERILSIYDLIFKALEDYPEMAALALTSEDAYSLKEEGRLAIYIGLENGYPIGADLSWVEKFYDLGTRYITLSHNRNNEICDSSTDPAGPEHNGISEFGKEVVKEMNRLGMIIDVSHISDDAFYDVVKYSKTPVVATHSNARALCDVPRNMSDDMLLALKENDGVIQVTFVGFFLKEMEPNPERQVAFDKLREKWGDYSLLSDEEMAQVREEWQKISEKYPREMAEVSDLVDHIDYIVDLIGVDHVGIGSDFDGGGGLKDCFDASEVQNITIELLKRGYTEKEIEKIWSGNFMRVFREVEKVAEKLTEEMV